MSASPTIVVAAGGTGGHMFPALAVAAELRERGCRVVILTDRRGARYVGTDGPDGWECRIVEAASPSGSLLQKLKGTWRLMRGARQARRLWSEVRPDAAATFGGYASVPAALAAALTRTPLLVHEQNAVFGRANRMIAKVARIVALSFAQTRAAPKGDRVRVTGNPVRPGFGRPTSLEPKTGFGLLVLGGSQGARVFSDVLPAAIALLPDALRQRLRLQQQCRPEDLERVRAAYAQMGFAAELAAFFNDVPARMAGADMLLCRSGASTVAELLMLGKPAILIPYPFAADNHQDANAVELERAEAALRLPQSEATPERLAEMLAMLIAQPLRLDAMRRASAGIAWTDAAARLADAVLAGVAEPAIRSSSAPTIRNSHS
ncbi:UDP-N-acetylglucosamine-N-acetylmuramylpentapeptide N-acetylglucosamine transferase [Arboricoccus pini]|uniref:UDP-N-acetylglucosamine--N-acetylmuramyl-(pentapeptide) pyrophosphoryl-undecaprenol N-acetylglucosamine transferase n=1 Tax=Arboricoccus pini TaxID=1963835 RepID=A0A212QAF4_9PROT|nr:undecaprenyldiphospho-muramoylpentapeptide beta-N-acetylglucosaminyltransferase [Arboricoccus pini]SNB56277.1 UDP-N-acetylglucosamine-N-acetylmuramylpentapeptide N-acetylglucosamine transferase [Arboricoccus pini]